MSSIFSNSETPPEYEPIQTPAPTTQSQVSTIQLHPELDVTSPFVGGSGVRIPLSGTDKGRQDLRNLSLLGNIGAQTWTYNLARR